MRSILDQHNFFPCIWRKKMRRLLYLGAIGLLALSNVVLVYFVTRLLGTDPVATEYGSFINAPPKVELLDDGVNVKLLKDFGYRDRRHSLWIAPKGYLSNGASIPWQLWAIVGSPLQGKYRNAAIIHDAACEAREHPPQDVHRAFYEACRCGGLDEGHAKLLYCGVVAGCPSWELVPVQEERVMTVTKLIPEQRVREVIDPVTGEKREETYTVHIPVVEEKTYTVVLHVPTAISTAAPGMSDADIDAMRGFIESKNPSLDEIDTWANARRRSGDEP